MSEYDSYALYKKYHVTAKQDNNLFNIVYQISVDAPKYNSSKINDEQDDAKIKSKKHQQGFRDKQQDQSKGYKKDERQNVSHQQHNKKKYVQKPTVKNVQKYDTQKSQPQQEQQSHHTQTKQVIRVQKLEQLQNVQQGNHDNNDKGVQIDIHLKRLNINKLKSQKIDQTLEEIVLAKKCYSISQKNRQIFDQYIQISQIQLSIQRDEGKYFKGKTLFNEYAKWSCKIITKNQQQNLMAEGRNTNRSIHQDQVYFTIISAQKDKTLCKVVAIISRIFTQIIGKIQYDSLKDVYLLRPTNRKIGTMHIHRKDVKEEWLQHISTQYFLAEFTKWDSTDEHPYCKVLNQYGAFGQIEIQTKALLKMYNIQERSYKKEEIARFLLPFQKNIDQMGEYTISQEQIKQRKDFRHWRVFFFEDCQFDAAFSINPYVIRTKTDPNYLKKNVYEINVHLMDVAYFVRQNSALDEQLLKKKVYYNLIHKKITFLPEEINEKILKFKQNKARLTISIAFQIDEQGNILDNSKITHSIVQPACSFTTKHLNIMLDKQSIPLEEWKSWDCGLMMDKQFKLVFNDIKQLNALIVRIREKRIQRGALLLDNQYKRFNLDKNGNPIEFQLRNKQNGQLMLEQIIINANSKLAQYLFKNLQEKTILYHHPYPGFKRLSKFKTFMKKLGKQIESSNMSLTKTINDMVVKEISKQCLKDLVKYETKKLFQQCGFFVTKDTDPSSWVNSIINEPLYVDCSAPTKSYAHILVQRQIHSVIDNQIWKIQNTILQQQLLQYNEAENMSRIIKSNCQKVKY